MLFHFKPIPDRWDPRWMAETFINLRKSLNGLTEANFTKPLDGDTLVKKGTLSPDRLKGVDLNLATLLALATPYTTTSTSLVQIGPRFYLDTLSWPFSAENFGLIITAGPSAVGAETIVELHDMVGAVASITANIVGQARYRAAFTRLPSRDPQLSLRIRTTSSSVAAGILGAQINCKIS